MSLLHHLWFALGSFSSEQNVTSTSLNCIASLEALRHSTSRPSLLRIHFLQLLWSCPKKMMSKPSTSSAMALDAFSIISPSLMPPVHPVWKRPTMRSGSSSLIVLIQRLALSIGFSRLMPCHNELLSQYGIAVVVIPNTAMRMPSLIIMV